MRSDKTRRRLQRQTTFEPLEQRQVMSADPLGGLLGGALAPSDQAADVPPLEQFQSAGATQQAPDFWLDTTYGNFEEQLDLIEQTLASANNLTGLTQVRQDYGFLGTGQTVAVIDSGIAWDHYALGGGFGANYRVVGGWDFAENDANPYDDGPSGSHGTHVSGIVGGNSGGNSADSGVAPGADLVGLRVFNDAGAGYFSWVESALQWVHQNRNSFENPITAVNLSLGTNWNADTVPSWAMLEDEFAQLEADGIFVAVAAGNAFTSYNTPGLSYPAASSHVVPVMSVDDSGLLSYYSQRSDRSIAAPGRYIRSTVPDYVGNHNGVTDDWASYSGTSMASPYVAGASVIVREAMELVGYTDVTQQTIYDWMISTADRFYDAATDAYYNRLNLSNAIDALIPDDDFGSSVVDAYNMGTLGGAAGLAATGSSMEIAGMIGTLDDADYFTFTAGASGTVSLTVTGTHGLEPKVSLVGGQATLMDGTWSFDVVAGEKYTFSLQAYNGLGYYDFALDFQQEAKQQTPLLTKIMVRSDGVVFSLDTDGWLSVNGRKIWNRTADFTVRDDGTIYWLSDHGLLARRDTSGTWKFFAHDAVKFDVASDGTIYSLGEDNYLSVNGSRIWNNTNDFSLAADGTFYWQSSFSQLWARKDGKWTKLDNNVTKMATDSDGTVYSLKDNHWMKVNGRFVWRETQDFVITEDQTLYWQSTDGSLWKRPDGGSWQKLEMQVTDFAISQDGTLYTLSTSGEVKMNGAHFHSNIRDLSTNSMGHLLLEGANGSSMTLMGRFITGMYKAEAYAVGGGTASMRIASTMASAASMASDVATINCNFEIRSDEQVRVGTVHATTDTFQSARPASMNAYALGQEAAWQNGNEVAPDDTQIDQWTQEDTFAFYSDAVTECMLDAKDPGDDVIDQFFEGLGKLS